MHAYLSGSSTTFGDEGDGPFFMKTQIDANWDDEVSFLQALVAVPSENPPGDCAPIAELAAALLRGLGFRVEEYPVPEPFLRQCGLKSVTNLIVREAFGIGGPTVALVAHGDVVPPGEGWSVDPYSGIIRSGALYGRGAALSKSDFATYAFALKALKDHAKDLSGTVELHFTFDEESGGFVGPKFILEQDLSKPDLAISAGFTHAITTAHNGCLHMEILVRGRQAHAAMPETGIDALEVATPILQALYEERDRLSELESAEFGIGSPKLTIGLISGGINTNVVPDRVTLRVDRRLIPEENGEQVERDLTALVDKNAKTDKGAEVECRRIMLAESMRPIAGTQILVDAIRSSVSQVLGENVEATGVPLYTDARHYCEAGVPTVLYGAGPRTILEANAHGADEHVQLSDLKAATHIIALTLNDLLNSK